jgi:hypothetical protein
VLLLGKTISQLSPPAITKKVLDMNPFPLKLNPATVRKVRMYKSYSESVHPADIADLAYYVCAESEGMPGWNIGHGIKPTDSLNDFMKNVVVAFVNALPERMGSGLCSNFITVLHHGCANNIHQAV